jgi:hypothetical protein
MMQVQKDELILAVEKLYQEKQYTVFDIYTYRTNSNEDEINRGHRFTIFLSLDNSRFAIDPLR